jgi:hypothetical protein
MYLGNYVCTRGDDYRVRMYVSGVVVLGDPWTRPGLSLTAQALKGLPAREGTRV